MTQIGKKRTNKPQTSPAEDVPREVRVLTNEMAGEINAHIVRMVQSGAETITGDEITMQQSGAEAIHGQQVDMRMSAAQLIEGQAVNMSQSGSLALRADAVAIDRGGAGVLTAQEAKLNDSLTFAVLGRRVDVTRGNSILLLGQEIQGDVETVLDQRSALLLGLGMGIGLGLLSLIKALLFKRTRE